MIDIYRLAAKAKYNAELKEHISPTTPLLPVGHQFVFIPANRTFEEGMEVLSKVDNPKNLPIWIIPKPVWLKQYLETLTKETK